MGFVPHPNLRAFPGSAAVLDDLAGRRCAEALGLPLRGTVGLVLAAKQAGRLAAARPVLERLRDSGMENFRNRAELGA